MIKLAIFDMDGLMFASEIEYFNMFVEYGKRYDIETNQDELYRQIGTSNQNLKKIFLDPLPKGIDRHVIFQAAIDEAVDKMCSNMPIKPGLLELMDYFEKKDVPMCVATSTRRYRAERMLKSANVFEKLAFLVSGEEVKHGKPEPDIFITAISRANVSPQEAIVFEDSPNGALASIRAQIPVIVCPDLKKPDEYIRNHALAVVDSLNEVPVLLEELK